jgi:hypothetical protein
MVEKSCGFDGQKELIRENGCHTPNVGTRTGRDPETLSFLFSIEDL